jgi:hypothetical protein
MRILVALYVACDISKIYKAIPGIISPHGGLAKHIAVQTLLGSDWSSSPKRISEILIVMPRKQSENPPDG